MLWLFLTLIATSGKGLSYSWISKEDMAAGIKMTHLLQLDSQRLAPCFSLMLLPCKWSPSHLDPFESVSKGRRAIQLLGVENKDSWVVTWVELDPSCGQGQGAEVCSPKAMRHFIWHLALPSYEVGMCFSLGLQSSIFILAIGCKRQLVSPNKLHNNHSHFLQVSHHT